MAALSKIRSWRTKAVLWFFSLLAISACCLVVFFAVSVVRALDTDKDLSDFASRDEARTFTSAHLPVPLPNDTVIQKLLYQRWTDWNFEARVEFSSSGALDSYLQDVRQRRQLNDEYCSPNEPSQGARFFLRDVSACGSITPVSPLVFDVKCNTR